MIVPMKKVSILCLSSDTEDVVAKLRGLGVLHVEHTQQPKGDDISSLTDDIGLVKEALAVLSEKEFLDNKCKDDPSVPVDWRTVARRIIADRKRFDQLNDYSYNMWANIAKWKLWGDFDPKQITNLAEKNIFLRLYEIPKKEFHKLGSDVVVHVCSERAGILYCCVVTREKIDIPFKEMILPRISLTEMCERLIEDKKTVLGIKKDIRRWSCYRNSFLNIERALEKELEFHEAIRGMGKEGELAYINGYIPFDSEPALVETSKKEQWGILITDPSADEQVPTLVRNPKWISVVQPLLKLLEILPGYTELDISPLFLIFFSLFFGMIIGDAGYGLLYLFITIFFHYKFKEKVQDKRIFYLMYVLSSCAIIWGILTGTFFGQAWLVAAGIKAIVPALIDPVFIQGLCFLIGVIHLSLGHSWQFIVKLPSLTALADLGWIIILWAAYFLVKTLLLGAAFPFFGKYMIAAGVTLVVLFSNPRKTLLGTIGAGLGNVALSIMNSFGDIVSYVRLFAVGLAGVAISDAFNDMAQGAAGAGIFGVIGAVLILIASHALNFVLSPMSVLVHGVRLNVLEFSGHAGVSWSGMPYRPLKKEV